MKPPSTHEVTQLLLAWSDGDQTALEELTPLVYAELRRLVDLNLLFNNSPGVCRCLNGFFVTRRPRRRRTIPH